MVDYKEIERIKGQRMANNVCNANVDYLLSANTALREQLAQRDNQLFQAQVNYTELNLKAGELQSQLAQMTQERDDLRQQLSGEQAFDLIAPRTLKKEVRDAIEELK